MGGLLAEKEKEKRGTKTSGISTDGGIDLTASLARRAPCGCASEKCRDCGEHGEIYS